MFNERKSKEGELYLNQIAGNMHEKTRLVVQAVNDLIKIKGVPLVVVDCGTGGGETLLEVKKFSPAGTHLVALDISEAIVKFVSQKTGSSPVVADAFALPFKSGSVDIINYSAVIHEIFSYSQYVQSLFNNGKNRLEVLEMLFKEVSMALSENGRMTYRDVYLPENYKESKQIQYSKNFTIFLNICFERIKYRHNKVFQLPGIDVNFDVLGKLNCTVSLHRELQRHFITLCDYLCRIMLKSDLATLVAVGDFDQIDATFEGDDFEGLVDEWAKREGEETYVYASLSEIDKVASSVGMVCVSKETPERYHYTEFLRRHCSAVVPDKKTLITFKK